MNLREVTTYGLAHVRPQEHVRPQPAEEEKAKAKGKAQRTFAQAFTLKYGYKQRYDLPYPKRPIFRWSPLVISMSGQVCLVAMGYKFTPPVGALALLPVLKPADFDLFYNLEQRATIRGGLAALQVAGLPGYSKIDLVRLKAATFQSEEDDMRLCRAVKAKNLHDAVIKIRKIVKHHDLGRLAFALRASFILDDMSGWKMAQGAVQQVVEIILDIFAAGSGEAIAKPVLAVWEGAIDEFLIQPFVEEIALEVKGAAAEAQARVAKAQAAAAATATESSSFSLTPTAQAGAVPVPTTPEEAVTQDLAIVEGGPFGLAASYYGVDTRYLLIGGAATVAVIATLFLTSDD
jgi:hypothetical protein